MYDGLAKIVEMNMEKMLDQTKMIEYMLAKKEDLKQLTEFLEQPEIDTSFIKPLSERPQSISERVKTKYENGLWVIGKLNIDIVGCLALILTGNEVELSTLAVSPNHQGSGIGAELWDYSIETAEKYYPDISTISFDSWSENKAIERIMEKTGFTFREEFNDPEKRPEGVKSRIYERPLNEKKYDGGI